MYTLIFAVIFSFSAHAKLPNCRDWLESQVQQKKDIVVYPNSQAAKNKKGYTIVYLHRGNLGPFATFNQIAFKEQSQSRPALTLNFGGTEAFRKTGKSLDAYLSLHVPIILQLSPGYDLDIVRGIGIDDVDIVPEKKEVLRGYLTHHADHEKDRHARYSLRTDNGDTVIVSGSYTSTQHKMNELITKSKTGAAKVELVTIKEGDFRTDEFGDIQVIWARPIE